MSKSIYSMEPHESLTITGTNTSILRVPGGWIYTQYHPYHHETGNQEYRATSTFVPWSDVREEANNA